MSREESHARHLAGFSIRTGIGADGALFGSPLLDFVLQSPLGNSNAKQSFDYIVRSTTEASFRNPTADRRIGKRTGSVHWGPVSPCEEIGSCEEGQKGQT